MCTYIVYTVDTFRMLEVSRQNIPTKEDELDPKTFLDQESYSFDVKEFLVCNKPHKGYDSCASYI